MSKESAQAFLELLKTDKDLAKKMAEVKSDDEAMAAIKAAGDFDFSKEEWLAVVREVKGQELSEEDLEKVAGGFNIGNWNPANTIP